MNLIKFVFLLNGVAISSPVYSAGALYWKNPELICTFDVNGQRFDLIGFWNNNCELCNGKYNNALIRNNTEFFNKNTDWRKAQLRGDLVWPGLRKNQFPEYSNMGIETNLNILSIGYSRNDECKDKFRNGFSVQECKRTIENRLNYESAPMKIPATCITNYPSVYYINSSKEIPWWH